MSTQYATVQVRGHPRGGLSGQVLAHIVIAEKALGHHLPEEHPVHHVDGNKQNNGRGNLVICQDAAYHRLLHVRTRALDATGNPNMRRCHICKRWDEQPNLTALRRKGGRQPDWIHSACGAAAQKARLGANPLVRACSECGTNFHRTDESHNRWYQLKLCPGCRVEELKARIKARSTVNADGCWIWTGQTKNGYPALWVDNRLVYAQRLAYSLFVTAIPEGKQLRRSCAPQLCVNPDHFGVRA